MINWHQYTLYMYFKTQIEVHDQSSHEPHKDGHQDTHILSHDVKILPNDFIRNNMDMLHDLQGKGDNIQSIFSIGTISWLFSYQKLRLYKVLKL